MNPALAKALDRFGGDLLARSIGVLDRVRETFRPPQRVTAVRRVLVVKFWGLGNWALLRPIVADLRASHPAARFTIATLAGNAPLVRDLADDLLLIRATRAGQVLSDLARAVRALRRRPPDLVVDFEQFVRAGALLGRLGGGAQRIGFATADGRRDDLYTVLVPFRTDRHVSRSFRDVAEAAGAAPGPYRAGGLRPTPAGEREVERLLGARAPLVVIHPGSGDNFPGRRWSPAGFAAVGRAAEAEGVRVVVSGALSERDLAREVAGAIGPDAVVAAGRLDVDGLVALLARASALVSNDTGPVHVASALGVPVLALYGPNTPVLYGPLSEGSVAFTRGLPCSPCLRVENYRSSRCRIHTCMASLPTGAVVLALARLLASRGVGKAGPTEERSWTAGSC